MQVSAVPKAAFDDGILDKDFHARLLQALEEVAQTAGIPHAFTWTKLSDYCEQGTMEWVASIKDGLGGGLAFVGQTDMPVEDKMMAITGCCLRNYVDGRMMTVQDVLNRLRKDQMPSPTVLLIPNFSMDKANGGDIPAWQVSSLLGLLYQRLAQAKKTVLYIGSMETLESDYGSAFRKHLEAHYTII